MTKSRGEWDEKKARGNANLNDAHAQKHARLNEELFKRVDRNEGKCDRILQFLAATKKRLAAFSGLQSI